MEVKITKTARKCAATDRPFAHGERVVSRVLVKDHTYVRQDFCTDAWTKQLADEAVAFWRTVYRDPESEQPAEVHSPLRQVFYDAAEGDGRADMALAYLASQLLRRQKVFRLIKESDDPEHEHRTALFADRHGDRLVEVPDPGLTLRELEAAREELMRRLAAFETPDEEVEANDVAQQG